MITTIEEVKDYLVYKGLLSDSDEKADIMIERLIKSCTQDFLDIRNAPWDTVGTLSAYGTVNLSSFADVPDDTPVYPDNAADVLTEMIAYKLKSNIGSDRVSSESINSYSVSYGSSSTINGYPTSIVGRIKRYTRGL